MTANPVQTPIGSDVMHVTLPWLRLCARESPVKHWLVGFLEQ